MVRTQIEDMFTPKEFAALINVPLATIQFWRAMGKGPRYVKLGNSEQSRVRYRMSDIVEWQNGLKTVEPIVMHAEAEYERKKTA